MHRYTRGLTFTTSKHDCKGRRKYILPNCNKQAVQYGQWRGLGGWGHGISCPVTPNGARSITAGERRTEPVFVDLLRRPWIDSQAGGPVRQPYFSYRPARLIGCRYRFLGSINVTNTGSALNIPCVQLAELLHCIRAFQIKNCQRAPSVAEPTNGTYEGFYGQRELLTLNLGNMREYNKTRISKGEHTVLPSLALAPLSQLTQHLWPPHFLSLSLFSLCVGCRKRLSCHVKIFFHFKVLY
jgi:hypothetical protein